MQPKTGRRFSEVSASPEAQAHKLLRPSQTRWLSLHADVARVLEQYDALTAFFAAAASTERLLTPATIHERLVDPVNKLVVEFADFILPSFTSLNRPMQSERPQLHTFRQAASTGVRTIMNCYLATCKVRTSETHQLERSSTGTLRTSYLWKRCIWKRMSL